MIEVKERWFEEPVQGQFVLKAFDHTDEGGDYLGPGYIEVMLSGPDGEVWGRTVKAETPEDAIGIARKGASEFLRDLADSVEGDRWMGLAECAARLGITSQATIDNWLVNGAFARRRGPSGPEYRYADVRRAVLHMADLRARNATGDVSPPESDEPLG